MKRALIRLLVLGLAAGTLGLGGGCGSDRGAQVGNGGDAPGGVVPGTVPLVSRLVVAPVVGKPGPTGARPLNIRMTLVVANTTSREYIGEAPDTALSRFAMTVDGETIWSYPTSAAQILTPVRIAPGQQVTYTAVLTVADARPYVGKVLLARGQFVPAGLTTTAAIPVN